MNVSKVEKILKGMANSRRLAILSLLNTKEKLNVSEIAEKIDLSFRATSQHLHVMENADLLNSRQEGLMVFYSLSGRHKKIIQSVLSVMK